MPKHISALMLISLSAAGLGGLAGLRAAPDAPAKPTVQVTKADWALPKALALLDQQKGAPIVAAIPAQAERIALKTGARPVPEVLDEIASQLKGERIEKNGITIIRPGSADETGRYKEYYRAMEGLAQFLTELSPERQKAVAGEEWLDFDKLPPPQQQRLKNALGDDAPGDETLKQWKAQSQIAAGFLFDPYFETAVGGTAQRYFFRTPNRFPQYNRLVPGSVPGTLKPGFAEGGQP